MGIHNFHTWLRDTYDKCFIPCNSKCIFDYVYIDVNHILHSSLNGPINKQEFLLKLHKSLDQIFCNFTATTKIILAVDGTSPYSKIILQRSRRLQGSQTVKVDGSKVTSLHLTPGTEFMNQVNKSLENYAVSLKQLYKYVKVDIECIPSTEHGEGEIKIFKKLLEHGNIKGNANKSHLVIGNDADLIVLAMAAKPVEYIYIVIRNQQKKMLEIVSVKKLINAYVSKLAKSTLTTSVWRNDFVIVSILMGNDYFPKLNFIKFESLWNAYYSTVKHLKTESLIVVDDLEDFITTDKLIKFNDTFIREFFTTININLAPRYRKLDILTYDKNKVKNYLEGMLWCLHMYQTGTCSMLDYMYKYKGSPNPVEISYFLNSISSTKDICIPESDTSPIRSDVFPLILIPKKAKTLIPKKYHTLMDADLKYLYTVEDCKVCLKIRSTISKHHKILYTNRDKTNENDIKQSIKDANLKLRNHKIQHSIENEFTLKDIKKIVCLTETL